MIMLINKADFSLNPHLFKIIKVMKKKKGMKVNKNSKSKTFNKIIK
jgi:hypothetical protein